MPALPPVDPNVKLPGRVRKQAADSEAIHAQTYQTQPPADPQPEPTPSPAPEPAPQPAPQPAPPPAPQPEPGPQPQPTPAPTAPQPQPDPRAPAAGDLTPDEWRHRYLSMEGRYKQAATSLGAMQEQMAELGDELMRSQQALQSRAAPQSQQPVRPLPPPMLTPEEIQAYGPELVDFVQRAARAAVMPDLQNVHSGVQQVQQRVQAVSAQTLYSTLDEQVPDWRTINHEDRFKRWLNLPDVYSGRLRGALLKEAFSAGHAARVAAIFKGFLAEEQATGQQMPVPPIPPAPQPPRTPAIPLELLTAPGRVKPAPGDNNPSTPADKPIFTRVQIANFYNAVRTGAYAGREPEKIATEQAIFDAQREGRVR